MLDVLGAACLVLVPPTPAFARAPCLEELWGAGEVPGSLTQTIPSCLLPSHSSRPRPSEESGWLRERNSIFHPQRDTAMP